MRLKLWVLVVLACAALPSATAGAKLAGKVLDDSAFTKVKTYCVDTSNLGVAPGAWIYSGANGPFNVVSPSGVGDVAHPEAFDVGEVMTRESRPKGLLRKLPWKLDESCSAAGVDAIVRFNFSLTAGVAILRAPTEQSTQDQLIPRGWRAQLQVSAKTSSSVIYKTEGVPLGSNLGRTAINQVDLDHTLRQSAAYGALAALVSDVRVVSKNP